MVQGVKDYKSLGFIILKGPETLSFKVFLVSGYNTVLIFFFNMIQRLIPSQIFNLNHVTMNLMDFTYFYKAEKSD